MDLQRIDNVMSSIPQELSIILKWRDIVGEQISKICIPSKIQNNILTVYAKNSTWTYELGFHKKKIITKVNKFLKTPIKSIKISVTPYIKDSKNKNQKITKIKDTPPIDLKNKFIEASTLYIKDPQLKKIAEGLIWKSVCKNKIN